MAWQRGLVAHRLLTHSSLQAMQTRGRLNNGKPFNYGLGVRITSLNGQRAIRHGGGISGFRAELAYFPAEELTIAVMANCDSVNTARLADRIARRLLPPRPAPSK